MNKNISMLAAIVASSLCLTVYAADNDKTAAEGISHDQAKQLNTQSDAHYTARKKVAEANEALNKADCKNALDGAAKRACEKSAKMNAKGQKADAKMVHEAEESAIKDAKK